MSGVDVLAVIKDAVKVFETPSFRLLVDHSEFAVEAGTLHQHLLSSYVAVDELIEATTAMNALAKGPSGGVSQQQKREIIARVEAALANVGAQP